MPGGQRHAPKPGQARSSQHRPRQAVAGGSPEIGRDEDKIADVIGPVIAAAGMDLESVRVSAAGRRRLLRVVVDSDRGVSLDDAAAISRKLSAALDAAPVMGDFPYTLEVSSPGVDRPRRKLHCLSASRPAYTADSPSSDSISSSRLYLATRSERAGAPVLIIPAPVATARSAIVVSSVSPERWEITAL